MKVYVLCQQHNNVRGDWVYEAVFSSKAAALLYGAKYLMVDEEAWEPYAYGGRVSPWRKSGFTDFQYRWIIFDEDVKE